MARDLCAICLSDIRRGQAVFVAECSHTFHHRCISDSVAHGNRDCPLCKATWRDVPTANPVPAPVYADDDPVAQAAVPQARAADGQAAAAGVGEMVLKTHCEVPAVARDAAQPRSAAALDLLTVLDVSGSMTGTKLALRKRAMAFVIDNLGPADRLCYVVSFSTDARREIRLVRMSGDGKDSAKRAVEALVARGSTSIGKGLQVAAVVLADRRYRNAVTSVILLSDVQDTYIAHRRFVELVPLAFRGAGSDRPGPIHTLGFGTDHDAAAMHADSFAQCIGGLLSVAAQGARIAIECAHPGVRVRQVESGRYESRVDAEGRAASVDVGELYTEDERRFLLLVDVPRASDSEDVTRLIKVSCTYKDTTTGQAADVLGNEAVVTRPAEVANAEVSVEVKRERVRLATAEETVAAQAAAERGQHEEARMILCNHRMSLRKRNFSNTTMVEDAMCEAMEDELEELEECMADEVQHKSTGRARVLTGISSHAQQRAKFLEVKCARRGRERVQPYMTAAMGSMLDKSKKSRENNIAAASEEEAW
ncbi:hypothetical protein BS78_01G211800 [Paspalum vaginatum]|nr:hypothetical protein BS78_01G211800 [Paspalum vaginatum]